MREGTFALAAGVEFVSGQHAADRIACTIYRLVHKSPLGI
jgi:hypothetical protein